MYYDYDGNRAHSIWHFSDGYYKNSLHQLDLLAGAATSGQSWTWLGDGIEATPLTTDDEIYGCYMNESPPNFTGFDHYILGIDIVILSLQINFVF